MTYAVNVRISAGELVDKFTILDLRPDRISDPDKRGVVNTLPIWAIRLVRELWQIADP